MAASSVFFVMIKYGKSLRVRSANKYWELVKLDKSKWEKQIANSQ
jgi:hypothetical protein